MNSLRALVFCQSKMKILRSSNNTLIVLGHGIAYCALLMPTFFELALYKLFRSVLVDRVKWLF